MRLVRFWGVKLPRHGAKRNGACMAVKFSGSRKDFLLARQNVLYYNYKMGIVYLYTLYDN